MKRRLMGMLSCKSWLLALVLPACAMAADPPVPLDLGDLGGDPAHPLQSDASSINDGGQVVGWSELPGGGKHAFLWPVKGRMLDLGSPTGQNSFATSINDVGTVVGNADSASGTRPWVWKQGQFILLPIPAGTYGLAQDVELNGVIAGCFKDPGQQYPTAVTWSSNSNSQYKMKVVIYGGITACAVQIDQAMNMSVGAAIYRNYVYQGARCPYPGYTTCTIHSIDPAGSGRMTGRGALGPYYWPNLIMDPEIYVGVSFCDNGGDGGEAWGINASSHIVGVSGSCKVNNKRYPNVHFFWRPDGESQALPPLNQAGDFGCCTHLSALNFADEVVGQSTINGSVWHATRWRVDWDDTVIPAPECMLNPCRVPPEVWYIPNRFVNNGIVSREGFDASRLDPREIMLGDGNGLTTKVARNADGTLMAHVEDINGDGLPDLLVTFSTTDLINDHVLAPSTVFFEVSAMQVDGRPFKSRYPVWVRGADEGL